MSLKVHLPSTENHGSQVLGENVGRRVGGSTGVGRGGQAAPSSCCRGAPAGRSGISIINFSFKASLTENYKLNRTPSTVTLNNNSAPSNQANQNFEEIQGIRDPAQIILHPGSGSNSTAVQNENLKTVAHKRGQRSSYTRLSKDSSELHTVAASEGAGFGEERESIL